MYILTLEALLSTETNVSSMWQIGTISSKVSNSSTLQMSKWLVIRQVHSILFFHMYSFWVFFCIFVHAHSHLESLLILAFWHNFVHFHSCFCSFKCDKTQKTTQIGTGTLSKKWLSVRTFHRQQASAEFSSLLCLIVLDCFKSTWINDWLITG